MDHLLHTFRDCGWPAWLALLIGGFGTLIGLVGTLLGALKKSAPSLILGALGLALAVITVGTGVVGRMVAEGQVEAVLLSPSISPDMRERIRAEGFKEAAACVTVGAGSGALPLILGALAVGIGLATQKKAS